MCPEKLVFRVDIALLLTHRTRFFLFIFLHFDDQVIFRILSGMGRVVYVRCGPPKEVHERPYSKAVVVMVLNN